MSLIVRPALGRSLLELLRRQGVRIQSDCGGQGTCGKCRVRVLNPTGSYSVLACAYRPSELCVVELPARSTTGRVAKARPIDPRLALAADIGTTTMSMAAVDTETGRVVWRQDRLNPQLAFGADVMTRIAQFRAVRKVDLLAPVRDFMAETGVGRRRTAVFAGNTAIIHFLLGRDPSRLGESPYRSRIPLGRAVCARVGGLKAWVPPLLDSFVGADCTAAILASGMHRRCGLELLVDAGTNGEVVLGNRDRLLVCSTAAGPAFEGATLECGSLAEPGAVREVRSRFGGFDLKTVGNRPARSLCGSGVLSAVAAALAAGRLEPSGRIVASDRLVLAEDPPVYLSQADIREVQLAVAALATGIRLLLAAAGRRSRHITRVHLTGKFGAAVSPDDAAAIGLLPDRPARLVCRHPNLALKGAALLAADPARRRGVAAVARAVEEVRLSGHEGFESTFIDSMRLGRWH